MENRKTIYEMLLQRSQRKSFLHRIVTGDVILVLYLTTYLYLPVSTLYVSFWSVYLNNWNDLRNWILKQKQ